MIRDTVLEEISETTGRTVTRTSRAKVSAENYRKRSKTKSNKDINCFRHNSLLSAIYGDHPNPSFTFQLSQCQIFIASRDIQAETRETPK